MAIKTYHKILKQKARNLRRRGFSYKEIGDKIGIVKSTAKLWCNDIILKPEYQKRLYTKQIEILSRGPKSSHERRKKEIEKIIEDAKNEIRIPISDETYKLFGAALYWAEGNKSQHFAITNSDPLLIKLMVRWFRDMFHAKPEDFKVHMNIYPQQNEEELKNFWSQITDIPTSNFGKSFVKPPNKKYKKNILYYGTVKIRLRKGTNARHRVFGWVKAVLKHIAGDVEKIERKWHKLKVDYPRP